MDNNAIRRQPEYATRERLLISQRGCCIYCMLPLDSVVYKIGKRIEYELQWDHFIPLSLLQSNPEDNFVAACHICNAIKSDFVYKTLDGARDSIQERRKQLGYTLDRPTWIDDDDNARTAAYKATATTRSQLKPIGSRRNRSASDDEYVSCLRLSRILGVSDSFIRPLLRSGEVRSTTPSRSGYWQINVGEAKVDLLKAGFKVKKCGCWRSPSQVGWCRHGRI